MVLITGINQIIYSYNCVAKFYFERISMSAIPWFLINCDQSILLRNRFYAKQWSLNWPRQHFQARTLNLSICMEMNKRKNESCRQQLVIIASEKVIPNITQVWIYGYGISKILHQKCNTMLVTQLHCQVPTNWQ